MKKKVYISSTSELKKYRDKLQNTVGQLSDFLELAKIMERMVAGHSLPPLEECKQYVRDSDIFILIIGQTYGSIDKPSTLSFTENEYNEACRHGKMIIALIESKKALRLKKSTCENEDKLERFRKTVKERHFSPEFKGLTDMENEFLKALYQHLGRKWISRDDHLIRQCNRDMQVFRFEQWERGYLNVFASACRAFDLPNYLTSRLAYSELGIEENEVIHDFPLSNVLVFEEYEKEKMLLMNALTKRIIPPNRRTISRNISDCLDLFIREEIDSIFIECSLSKADQENSSLIDFLERLFNDLGEECLKKGELTIFFVIFFEFGDSDNFIEHQVTSCITKNERINKHSCKVIDMKALGKVKKEDIKSWLKKHLIKEDDVKVHDVLSRHFPQDNFSYTMIEATKKMREVLNQI